MTELWGHKGREKVDIYIGRIFVFDTPTVLIEGRRADAYVVLEYFEGCGPDDETVETYPFTQE